MPPFFVALTDVEQGYTKKPFNRRTFMNRETHRKNLTLTQRRQIESMLNDKTPLDLIAEEVGCSVRTIYNEKKRGAYQHKVVKDDFWHGKKVYYETRYSADIAQNKYEINMTAKGRPLKLGNDFAFVHYVEKRVIKDKLSPCAVVGEIRHKNLPYTHVSKTTIYRYIRLGLFENITMGQASSEKRKYEKTKIKRPPKGTSIERRPREISERQTFGHWEMDCVCGPNTTVILNLTERLTRKVILFRMPNQKSASVVRCLNSLERRYGKMFRRVFKSITVDNGSEFADVKGMEKSIYGGTRTKLYYCHPYSAWERGSNERLNREARKIVPKGTDLSKLKIMQVKQLEEWLNNYPRQVLSYATSGELFDSQMQLLSQSALQ